LKRLLAFDVDSTLLRVESLDTAIEAALSRREDSGAAKAELHAITRAGMSGSMALRDSLEARLHLADLDRAMVTEVADQLRQRLTPGMHALLKSLRDMGDDVHAVSGGFGDLLVPALTDLGFEPSQIHANQFQFDGDHVAGLDPDCPLSRNGGKAEILRVIGAQADMVIMIGDGMTDFEAFEAGAADRFIGFGAIEAREVVIAAAEWGGGDYVRSVGALGTALRR
jgi:phosphoserine phosphatase